MEPHAASCGVSKRNFVEAKPASAFVTRHRAAPARRRFALTCYGAVRHAIHPCSKLQGILAKANKI